MKTETYHSDGVRLVITEKDGQLIAEWTKERYGTAREGGDTTAGGQPE